MSKYPPLENINTSRVQGLEQQKANFQLLIERRELALKLYNNRDFRKLILEHFCLNDAARYVQESADPMLPEQQRADALAMAQASGHLKRYLSLCVLMGADALSKSSELEEMLAQARAGGDNEDEE